VRQATRAGVATNACWPQVDLQVHAMASTSRGNKQSSTISMGGTCAVRRTVRPVRRRRRQRRPRQHEAPRACGCLPSTV